MTKPSPSQTPTFQMEPFLRAEQYGYRLVSSDYLDKLESVVEAARRARYDPAAEYEVEDALTAMGKI